MKNYLLTIILASSLLTFGQTSALNLETHLQNIIQKGNRDHLHTDVLDQVADYIQGEFGKYTTQVRRQWFEVNGRRYSNVVAQIGDTTKPRVVIGAHYDVCGQQDGADDNGSGVVGLIESIRQLKDYDGPYCLEFVAYTLEEPPYFRTNKMGSHIHAKDLKDRAVDVYGMVSLEMIGFFSDERKSQDYPLGILKMIYGGKGNYITLVRKFGKGKFVRKMCKGFRKSKLIKTKRFTAPRSLPGIDFSDHLNYWNEDMDAMMITDTAFYRNKNYHEHTDTMGILDFNRMSLVVDAVVFAIQRLK